MIICIGGNDEILWLHPDNEIKQLPEYINDDNVIVVEKELGTLCIPDDGKIYIQKWDWEKQERYLESIDPPTTIEDVKQDTTVINENVETTSYDNLINMDMLLAMDEKLNLIMEHLGLTL